MPGIIALAACCFEICGDRDEGGDCAFVSHPKIRIGAIPIVHKLLSETLTLGRMLMILGCLQVRAKWAVELWDLVSNEFSSLRKVEAKLVDKDGEKWKSGLVVTRQQYCKVQRFSTTGRHPCTGRPKPNGFSPNMQARGFSALHCIKQLRCTKCSS